jgi:excinuclease ABC subunit A
LPTDCIQLRGVAVNNLKRVDLDIPRRKLVVLCGVSGSGKTSLALDTLYAEGQRRYIDSLSAYTRQFLARLPKPTADQIEGIPPAIAITHKNTTGSGRATIGTATEILDYLRVLYARVGHVHCLRCGRRLRQESSETIGEFLDQLPSQTRFLVTFPQRLSDDHDWAQFASDRREAGFVRFIAQGRTYSVEDRTWPQAWEVGQIVDTVVDRLTVGSSPPARIRESLETAMTYGQGRCGVLVSGEAAEGIRWATGADSAGFSPTHVDDRTWLVGRFCQQLYCEPCDWEHPRVEPNLYSFNSPLGACPVCEGFGNVMRVDMDLVVPDRTKSIAQGAIAPWNTPAYRHELEELLELADRYGLPVDVPFQELAPEHQRLIQEGVPERRFGGLRGFFAWLERRKYKMHIRVFLSRWRSYRTCKACAGTRLRPEALTTLIGQKNLGELCRMKVSEVIACFTEIALEDPDREMVRLVLDQIRDRLGYLEAVGLGYLSLDRPLRSLSSGEAQRVALTSSLGSRLVNMLYVLDEPSVGLHPHDVSRMVRAIEDLRNRGNTVLVVEHEPSLINAADRVIEVGPGAGEEGGRITFEGTPARMRASQGVLTGDYLAGRRGRVVPERRREPNHGWIRLKKASGNNLKHIDVDIPLGVLCLITGVSGSGKSTLIENTLYPALCRRKNKESPQPYPYSEVIGDGQLDDIMLIDQRPIGRSPRSNPVTYIKAFDAIRAVFAETTEARTRNLKASHFSFNVEGGRCEACQGDGMVKIDMQFLADVMMECSECCGSRYRQDVLEITYRGKNIAEVLGMSVRQAYSFFRGQTKVQARLHQLIHVGLDYLRLGQPATTLSAGEAQRLKLAGYLASPRRGRTLFLMDEPTTGLHYADVVQLLDCFDALLGVGHSLVVVEHNLQMMQAADYIIDLGPGAAEQGGTIVAQGTPEQVARSATSITGRLLAAALADST